MTCCTARTAMDGRYATSPSAFWRQGRWRYIRPCCSRQLTSDLTMFLHSGPQPTDEELEQLAARDICVVDGEVESLEVTDDRLSGVRLRCGEVISVQALVVGPRVAARAEILVALGLEVTQHPLGLGDFIDSDATGLTLIPGVWVAGNVTGPKAQVIGSAAAGVTAGAAINADLIADEVQRAVAARRFPSPGSK